MLAATPTFHKDVEPLLQKHCQTCHRAGGAAPMSLVSYNETRPWAKAIQKAVLERKMPPWFADSTVGAFSNDPTLKNDEIATLDAWVEAGAPEGLPQDAPRRISW